MTGAAALLLLVTGCLQDPNTSESGANAAGGFAEGGTSDGDGAVQILGAFGGAEAEGFEAAVADFEDESGIDIEYVPDTDFTTTIKARVDSGQSPDIAFFPQPGGMLEMAEAGDIQPIDTFLDFDALDRSLIPGFLEAARLNGRVYGAPMRLTLKSLLVYPKQAWEQQGLPTEFETMEDLTQALQDAGSTPWCMGWFSDQATGWVGTDWIEEYVLRLQGPEWYDLWTSHEVPFNDPAVVEAFDEFAKIAKSDQVFGGVRGILNTPFGEALYPAFKDNPSCVVERTGNFVTGFLPAAVLENLDAEVGVTVLPTFADGYEGQPILGGGDLAALFNGNDDEAIEVMRFLTSDQFGGPWANQGGWLSPHRTFDASQYSSQTERDMAAIASEADVFRFDGSDLMPKEVGSGTFWTGMVEWLQGKSSQQAADEIEDSWPESGEGS